MQCESVPLGPLPCSVSIQAFPEDRLAVLLNIDAHFTAACGNVNGVNLEVGLLYSQPDSHVFNFRPVVTATDGGVMTGQQVL